MKKGRIVVRIEISTLLSKDGKLNHQKMDRLAMVLSNLQNSGKELLLVTSGAITLGAEKLQLKIEDNDVVGLMAAAAVGQAELIKLYQHYFEQYNQMVAQVLLTSGIMENPKWKKNTQNTFETLLSMNIIPIINENDAVSKSDIELDDNYPLARNVAEVSKSDIILIKSEEEENYIIQPRNGIKASFIYKEAELLHEIEETCIKINLEAEKVFEFPESFSRMVLNTNGA
jgi:glutamate 5-kinase